MDAPVAAVVAAALPLVLLAVLVFGTRASLGVSAWVCVSVAVVLALTVFDLDPLATALGAGKGAWTALWILLLVVPALLLFQVNEASGALDRLSGALETLAPSRGRRLLLLAWVFPSFIQGVAGFGVPVVVAAPMLVRTGVPPVAAIVACNIGYHWSVTFGSMGSSFFVAAGTTQLSADDVQLFAAKAAGLLAVNCLAAGVLLALRERDELGETLWRAVALALLMGLVLLGVAIVQPALGSTAAGLAGLLGAGLLLPRRGTRPQWRTILLASAPYLALTLMVVVAFGVPAVTEVVGRLPAASPSFPETSAAFGHVNPPLAELQPFRPLLHAGPYLLLSVLVAVMLYRRLGWWADREHGLVAAWLGRSWTTAVSLVALTVLAGVMVDAGMMSALAETVAAALGKAYVAVAPALGALGTILTGSTTASNALLSPLQADAAARIDVAATTLLAGQTAGGNVGNALTPVTILVSAVAAGSPGQEGVILRQAARQALPLLALVALGTAALAVLA